MSKSVGDLPQGRVLRNPGLLQQAGLSSQAQNSPQPPALVKQDRRASSALVMPEFAPSAQPNRLVADVWLTTEPVLAMNDQDFIALALPMEVWHLILTQLSDVDQVRAMRACRGLYHWGRNLVQTRLHPESPLGQHQRADCSRTMASIGRSYLRRLRLVDLDKKNIDQWGTRFETKLLSLAMRHRCLELEVVTGMERAVVVALATGSRWQSVHLKFDCSNSSFDPPFGYPDMEVFKELEKRLASQGRRATVDLTIDSPSPSNWPLALDDDSSLLPIGLQLSEIEFRELKRLPGLKSFLESDNALERLVLLRCEGEPAQILAWLKRGSHSLTSLALAKAPDDGQLLLEVLKAKSALTSLAFEGLTFSQKQLTLAGLLQAAPRLEQLNFGCVEFKNGANSGSHDALRNSNLREIEFGSCYLAIAGSNSEEAQPNCDAQIGDTHKEFLHGLQVAPKLQVLTVSGQMPPNSILWHSQLLMLNAFLRNPQARILCSRSYSKLWLRILDHHLNEANAVREQEGWRPVELRVQAEYGMEKFDPKPPCLYDESSASEKDQSEESEESQ